MEHMNFGPKKHFHSYLYVSNSKNFSIEHNFGQSLEMGYSGVQLYVCYVSYPVGLGIMLSLGIWDNVAGIDG